MFRYYNIARRLSSSSIKLPHIPSAISSPRFLCSSSSTRKETQQNCSHENLMVLENRLTDFARSGYHDLASSIARDTFFSRKNTPVSICNIVLDSMCTAGRYNDFFSHFRFFFSGPRVVPNSKSFHHLIRVYCDTGCTDDALEVYNNLFDRGGTTPCHASHGYLSKALVDLGRFDEAGSLLQKIRSRVRAPGEESTLCYNLISGHIRHGLLDDDHWGKAHEYAIHLRNHCDGYEGTADAIFTDWYFSNNFKTNAMELYRRVLTRPMTSETCNAFLECLIKHGESLEASKLFDRMLRKRSHVNSVSCNIMVNHCFQSDEISEAMAVFKKLPDGVHDATCFNNIIEKLCEKGLVSEAKKLLAEEMPKKNVAPDFATYQMLIEAYLKPRKRATTAIALYKQMVFESKLTPHKGFCEKVFDQLIKKGKIEEVSDIIEKIGATGRDVKPEPICYKMVITGLVAAGKLDKAKVLLNQMVNNFSAPTLKADSTNKDVLAIERWCDLKGVIRCKGSSYF